jgi:hypothetical protein
MNDKVKEKAVCGDKRDALCQRGSGRDEPAEGFSQSISMKAAFNTLQACIYYT